MSNRHNLTHSPIACKSYCNRLTSCKLLTTQYNVKSFAYINIFEYFTTLQISFIYNRKRGGGLTHRLVAQNY